MRDGKNADCERAIRDRERERERERLERVYEWKTGEIHAEVREI